MFAQDSERRYPSLSAYVREALAEATSGLALVYGVGGILIVPSLATTIGYLFGLIFGFHIGLIVGLALLPILLIVLGVLVRRWTEPRTERQRKRKRVVEALGHYQASIVRRRLHRELDPNVGQLLESCAHFHQLILNCLDGAFWRGQPGHNKALEEQARRAANEAMGDAVILGAACIGKPGKTKGEDLKTALRDLAELEIQEAMQGFRTIAKSDRSRYSHQSPHLSAVLEPLRQIAGRLEALSGEVQRFAAESAMKTVDPGASTAVSSIDLVLSEMGALRQAQSELEEQPNELGDSRQ